MPYRETQPAVTCQRHHVAAAVATCAACGEPCCLPCVTYRACRPTCARCEGRRRTIARWARRIGAAAALLATSGLLSAGWLVTQLP